MTSKEIEQQIHDAFKVYRSASLVGVAVRLDLLKRARAMFEVAGVASMMTCCDRTITSIEAVVVRGPAGNPIDTLADVPTGDLAAEMERRGVPSILGHGGSRVWIDMDGFEPTVGLWSAMLSHVTDPDVEGIRLLDSDSAHVVFRGCAASRLYRGSDLAYYLGEQHSLVG